MCISLWIILSVERIDKVSVFYLLIVFHFRVLLPLKIAGREDEVKFFKSSIIMLFNCDEIM